MDQNKPYKQPWLHSPITDGIFILSPPFVALLLVICFPAQFQQNTAMPVYYWLFLVVFIDVAHVYSTLYRTYFVKGAFKKHAYLIIIPAACYIAGVVMHSYDGMVFWRTLAYLAVFHFIRQQYGFMRLYSREEVGDKWFRLIDKVAIYTATIYPLYFWHFEGNREFNWFVDNDIVSYRSELLLRVGLVFYLAIILAYLIKEITFYARFRNFNWPRNLLVLGTFVSWYFGIVYFNGDLAFTTLNVISHGIPYMALVWSFEKKRNAKATGRPNLIMRYTFNRYTGAIFFVLFLALLAYVEEGLWDGMIWKEHVSVFSFFAGLPKINNKQLLSLLLPLLALPQSTHYVLDGFIWKIKRSEKEGTVAVRINE